VILKKYCCRIKTFKKNTGKFKYVSVLKIVALCLQQTKDYNEYIGVLTITPVRTVS